MNNNMKDKIISITISLIIILLMIMFIFNKKEEFSYNENRYLQKFPDFTFEKLINNQYLDKLTNYFSDYFPFRNELINIRTNTLLFLGFKEVNNVFVKNDYLIEKYKKPEKTKKLINKLNYINEQLDVDMSIMLVPTSVSINKEYIPKFYVNNQIDTLNYIYNNLDFKTINVYDVFHENKDKYQLYYYMDHHWTIYGAYLAYVEYCKQNDIKNYDLSDFTITPVSNDFKGTLYSKILKTTKNDVIYKIEKDDIKYTVKYIDHTTNTLYDDKYLNEKDKYSYYLSNNSSIIEIETNVDNNEELLIIKDSYANSIVPYLVNHYKKLIIIDPRYYKSSIIEYVKNNNIKKVLFIYNMNTIDTDSGIYTID